MTKKFINLVIKKRNWKDSELREKTGIFSGITGIVCNLLLFGFKMLVGTLTGSVSITADAVNNLSDAGSNIVTIAGSKLAGKPVDKEHPFGHGRLEYISALVVAFLIFIMGFELGKSSIEKIIHPQEIKFSIWYIIILTAAICVKLWMAYFNNTLYKKSSNINLKAVMQDSLNDCIATGSTIVALLISSFTSFKRADGIIGVIVAVVILMAGINILKEIIGPLLGQPPSPELVKSIEQEMLKEELIVGVHDLIVHDYGPGKIIASAHAEVPSDVSVTEIHDVIDNVEKDIMKKLKVVMCIHMDPIVIDDEEVNRYKELTAKIIKQYDADLSFHDFKVVKGPTHTNLIFDLVVPFGKNQGTNAEILNGVRKAFKDYDDTINLVVTVEHSYI